MGAAHTPDARSCSHPLRWVLRANAKPCCETREQGIGHRGWNPVPRLNGLKVMTGDRGFQLVSSIQMMTAHIMMSAGSATLQ